MRDFQQRFLGKIGIMRPARVRGIIPMNVLRKYVPSTATIFEIGAHVGTDTEQLHKTFPRAKIYAFEPLPTVYRFLEERVKKLDNVECYALAMSDRNGEAELYVSSGERPSSSSLRKPKLHLQYHPDITFEQIISVPCVTLDDWCKQQQIPKIDFIWIDVQGHELSVFKGGLHMLKTVSAIYTEVNLQELYEGTPLYPELRAWLAGQGFKVAVEALDWEDAGNVLFVRE